MAKTKKATKEKKSKKEPKSEKVESKSKKPKKEKKAKKEKQSDLSMHQKMAAFYAKKGVAVENSLHLVSNALHDPERGSFDVLQLDWLFGGGPVPGMTLISGEEQSGKTTALYHALGNSISHLGLPYNVLYDAEGSVSKNYTGNIWEPFGLDINKLLSDGGRERGFYYIRNNVIEKMFDYLKRMMKLMPDKNWNNEANGWCYYFPKGDADFKHMMEVLDLKPSAALSKGGAFHVVPTDYAGPEGMFAVDSFAALLTKASEEKEESGSERSAMEASEFSKQLKRIKVDVSDKKIVLIGANQMRSHVRAVYGGPDAQIYDTGGKALQFYSDARARFFSRSTSSAKKYGSTFAYDKDSSQFGIEPSVETSGTDRYAYKEIKNTKNKFGKPGLKTLIRVWVSDARGKPRGIDPAFDVFVHLINTRQLRKTGKNKTPFQFNLDITVGKALSEKLNASNPFTFQTLKKLVIGEYTGDIGIIKEAAKELGISFRPHLRDKLFTQLREDDGVLYSNISKKSMTESDEMEDDDASTDYEEL